MCKPEERSFIIDIWCSYILRAIVKTSFSGGVVVTFVSMLVNRPGPWV